MKLIDFLFKKSPVFIQNTIITSYGYLWKRKRLGGNFSKYVREIKEREFWSREKINDFVEQKFKFILKIAYKRSVYYRSLFRSIWDIKQENDLDHITLKNLSELPILTKEELRVGEREILTQKKGVYYDTTGGTTGIPLKVYINKDIHQHILAWREARLLNWAGVSIKDKRVTITGRALVNPDATKPPYWRFNFAENQMYIPSFILREDTIKDIVRAINRWKPKYIIGYANSILYLLQLADYYNLDICSTKIITIAEKVQPSLKKLCLKYNLPLFEEYGQSENVAYATTCECGSLHIHTDFGIIEVIKDKLISTSLINYVYPLIRYDTGDLIKINWSKRCECGRVFPIVEEIIGREDEYVLTNKGKIRLNPTMVLRGITDVGIIRRVQIVQNTIDTLTILLEVDKKYKMNRVNLSKNIEIIQSNLKAFLGNDLNIVFKIMDKIPLNKNGKFKFIVRNVKFGG